MPVVLTLGISIVSCTALALFLRHFIREMDHNG
jgi:hypothetical protein